MLFPKQFSTYMLSIKIPVHWHQYTKAPPKNPQKGSRSRAPPCATPPARYVQGCRNSKIPQIQNVYGSRVPWLNFSCVEYSLEVKTCIYNESEVMTTRVDMAASKTSTAIPITLLDKKKTDFHLLTHPSQPQCRHQIPLKKIQTIARRTGGDSKMQALPVLTLEMLFDGAVALSFCEKWRGCKYTPHSQISSHRFGIDFDCGLICLS